MVVRRTDARVGEPACEPAITVVRTRLWRTSRLRAVLVSGTDTLPLQLPGRVTRRVPRATHRPWEATRMRRATVTAHVAVLG